MPKRAMGQAGNPYPRLVVGTDFSGLDGILMILDKHGIKYLHAFSSEIDTKARQFHVHHHKPLVMYGDVTERVTKDMPPIDLHALGPPCVAHSKAGLRQRSDDVRGCLWTCGLQYILEHKPGMVILENVIEFMNDPSSWNPLIDNLEE